MRVLIGCETSGVMRRAFAARGHDTWSIDLLPSDDDSPRHIIGDVRDHLEDGWDLAIMHPPCTRLCNSGVRWLHVPPPGRSLMEMWVDLDEGAALFTACWQAPIARVAVENPIMHKYAKARMPADLPRPQIVQPWWFGEPAKKATGFYLRGLPGLVPTNRLPLPEKGSAEDKRWQAVHLAPPGPDRWKFRSRTFAGIAEACADQWSRT